VTALVGPASCVPVLAVLGFLVAREFVRELRPSMAALRGLAASLVIAFTVLGAFSILVLRLLSFST
jgi:hypothetical protein